MWARRERRRSLRRRRRRRSSPAGWRQSGSRGARSGEGRCEETASARAGLAARPHLAPPRRPPRARCRGLARPAPPAGARPPLPPPPPRAPRPPHRATLRRWRYQHFEVNRRRRQHRHWSHHSLLPSEWFGPFGGQRPICSVLRSEASVFGSGAQPVWQRLQLSLRDFLYSGSLRLFFCPLVPAASQCLILEEHR